MVNEIVVIANSETKFDEMTVAGCLIKPRIPTVTKIVIAVVAIGINTQRSRLKNANNMITISPKTVTPNVVMSFLTKRIISDATKVTPPR